MPRIKQPSVTRRARVAAARPARVAGTSIEKLLPGLESGSWASRMKTAGWPCVGQPRDPPPASV